jgi:hypothetical protein
MCLNGSQSARCLRPDVGAALAPRTGNLQQVTVFNGCFIREVRRKVSGSNLNDVDTSV